MPQLGEVGAQQGVVVPVVEPADLADPVLDVLIVEPPAERISRVRGKGDERTFAQSLHHLSDRAGLRIVRVNFHEGCH